jgi:hypothetical protein
VHGRGSSDLGQQVQLRPLSNPDPGGMAISPGRRVLRRVTRCHRPWPGRQAPTNPPSSRARPSRSRMARLHRTPPWSGLPGTSDSGPWPQVEGSRLRQAAWRPAQLARREDELGLPGLLRRPQRRSHTGRTGTHPWSRRPVSPACPYPGPGRRPHPLVLLYAPRSDRRQLAAPPEHPWSWSRYRHSPGG